MFVVDPSGRSVRDITLHAGSSTGAITVSACAAPDGSQDECSYSITLPEILKELVTVQPASGRVTPGSGVSVTFTLTRGGSALVEDLRAKIECSLTSAWVQEGGEASRSVEISLVIKGTKSR